MRKFVFVVGPTASGKSQLALKLAQASHGVIFNCDSIQLYQQVEIGSAKPSKEEMQIVPHYLFDVVAPPNEITSAEYRRIFLKELEKIPLSKTVFVVGGTGFYFLALEKGLYEIEEASAELKAQVELELQSANGPEILLNEVRSKDADYAAKLHLNDHYRISRAVEILRSNPNKTITDLLKEKKQTTGLEGRILKIGVKWDASVLEERIRKRTQIMLRNGLLKETKSLIDQGLRNWAPLRSVGYKEALQCLDGEIQLSALEDQIVIATRQLAKKQRTWFQRDQEIHWCQGLSNLEYEKALNFIKP